MTKGTTASRKATEEVSAAKLIDARIEELGDWRGETLARVRMLIKQADPDVVEQVKWKKPANAMRGVPVWEHAGIICTGETYKTAVKLTFARGAALADPTGLFNASLEGNLRRAIDIHEGDKIGATRSKRSSAPPWRSTHRSRRPLAPPAPNSSGEAIGAAVAG